MECDKAFYAIKEYLASPLTLSQVVEGDELYLYLVASATEVSTTLVKSYGDGRQRPVYLVSKMLTDAETKYIDFE